MSDTEAEEKIFEVEVARNGRAGCKKCKQKCLQGDIRIAKLAPNPFGEGKMKNWHHMECMFEIFKKQRVTTNRIEDESDIGGFDILCKDDQKVLRQKISEINAFFGTSPKKTVKLKHSLSNASPNKLRSENTVKPNSSKASTVSDEYSEDDLFQTFQNIVNKVSDHPSYLDKTAIIKKFFTSGCSGKKFNSDVEIWCRMLLPQSDKRIYNLQSKQLVKIFSRMFVEDQDEMLEHLEQGDVSETVSQFYKNSRKFKSYLPSTSTITIQKVDKFLFDLSKLTREEDQINHFEKILKKLTPDDLKTIIRLIKHDLRMGAGPKHILEGIHPDAYEVYTASKNLDQVVKRCFGSSKLEGANIKLLTPVFPMLAEPCKSVEMAMKKCPNGMFSEIKYDGERVQVHKQGAEFRYFSRALKPVLPHKVAHFKDHISNAFPNANDLILDTEILMMDTNTGKPLPFGTLGIHKKAEFRDATVCLFVFDCLYFNGESLLDKPLKERKRILNANMTEIPNHIVFSEMKEISNSSELVKMIANAFKLNLEGLVLKDVMGKYEPAKRHWLKVKKDYLFDGAMADSADLIALGAWYGTGKKGGMMSVFLMGSHNPKSGKFCTVTKVHTGHDDKTLEKLQKELKMVKISGDPNKVPSWLNCTRTMVPDFVAEDPKNQPVWEITGAEFTRQHDVHTAHGISIRFPRVTKIRSDKCWKTATTVDELKELFKKSKEHFDASLLMKELKSPSANSENKRKNSDNGSDEVPTKKVKRPDDKSPPVKTSNLLDFVGKKNKSKDKPLEIEDKNKNSKSLDESWSKNSSNASNNTIDPNKRSNRKKKNSNESASEKSDLSESKKQKVQIENPLPLYFEHVNAYFENKDNDMERFIIAYGGQEIKHEYDTSITHVIHSTEEVSEIGRAYPKSAKHVCGKWIQDTMKLGQLQDWTKYVVRWVPTNSEKCNLLENFQV